MENTSIHTTLFTVTAGTPRPRGSLLALVGCATLLVSLVLAAIIANYGALSFVLVMAGLIAIPSIYIVLAHPKQGLLILLSAAYFIMFAGKVDGSYPVGIVMDGLVALLIVSFFLHQRTVRDWAVFRGGVSVMLLLWVGYNLLEVLNPTAESRMAWLYAVRPIAFTTLTYFLFVFFIRDVQFVRTILKLWLCLGVFAALYGLKQEYLGFADFEMESIRANPLGESLYFIGNHWRKSSLFSDPVAFAYNMVICAALSFSMMTAPMARWKKAVLFLCGVLCLFSMLYSGTRGAYVLVPVTFLFFGTLRLSRKVVIAGIVVIIAIAGLIYMPTSNYTLYRFQSAFKPSKDASFNVRKINQHRIQPFIQAHPLGGGIGSTGVWGQRFSPNSYLANFPPDSGYVRVAVEAGWLGLLLFCTFMFVVLRTGIRNYFRIRDPELKSYCLAALLIIFALNIGNYPQEALVQYPINILFYLAIALPGILLKLDKNKVSSLK